MWRRKLNSSGFSHGVIVIYRGYLNSTDRLLGLVGGFKVYSEKLV
jgi:hypothetical protein